MNAQLKETKYKHILEINAKEWFDKSAGNSYFSAVVVLDDEVVAELPFQYGYGDHYLDMAMQEIQKTNPKLFTVNGGSLWSICANNNIKLISNKQENCLKRELSK